MIQGEDTHLRFQGPDERRARLACVKAKFAVLLLELQRLGPARRLDHDHSGEPSVRPWRARLCRRERRGVSHVRRHDRGRGLIA